MLSLYLTCCLVKSTLTPGTLLITGTELLPVPMIPVQTRVPRERINEYNADLILT